MRFIMSMGNLLLRPGVIDMQRPGLCTVQESATVVARRVLQGLTELALPHSGCKAGLVTLSIGISTTAPGVPALPEELIASADRALYQAKHAGRNRIIYDHPF
ncbi:MAG: diguanylate cyclase [Rhodoferax sp.]